jgi:hypothetical protein
LKAEFQTPRVPRTSAANIPLVNLTPSIATTGGSLQGGQTLYYAVSAKDADGSESGLSFAVRAKVPSGTNTNSVTLNGLSFSAGTAGFNVYRGPSPSQVLLIAEDHAVGAAFVDAGLAAQLVGPPDEAYDHANFYWRLELIPENAVVSHSPTSVGNPSLGLGVDDFKGATVRITRGTGATQERTVVSNTATVLTVTPPWRVEPDSTSFFTVAEATWRFAGQVTASPIEIQGLPQPGSTVQISGRAANVANRESAYELSPVTRWQIGSGGGVDTDAPPAPVYGLNALGDGTLELAGIGFTTFANTYGISAGVLDLFWWNELNSPSGHTLAAGISASETSLTLSAAGTPPTPLIQIGAEILEVTSVVSGGTVYNALRGAQGSTAAIHAAGVPVYHLERTTVVIPFVRGFFGSPASGSFRQSISLPDVRVGVANLYMINGFGNGLVGYAPFGGVTDNGLRTLSGGQISIQVEGYLAIQDNAAPALVMDRSHAVRDIFAVVREAPDGGDIELTVRQGGVTYCTLTIPDGETISSVVSGFGLPPLGADARLYLDVTSVTGGPSTLPGRDLTVTIRL